MNKNWLYVIVCIVLFVVFLKLSVPIWFLFAVLTIYYVARAIRKGPSSQATSSIEKPMNFGVLDSYAVDGDPSDFSYGMYIQLDGRPVFLDIREDVRLEQRKLRALELYRNQKILEESLHRFIAANPKFQQSAIASIGLHADDLTQGEVFWDPDGYTLLKGFEFV